MKALLVGCGSIGKRHLKNLMSVATIEHIFVYSNVKDCLSGIKDKHKVSLVKSMDVPADLAIIANETHKHLDTAIILARKGIPLFIEKPISLKSSLKLDLLKRIIRQKKVVVGVGYNLRFLGALKQVKSYLNQNVLGEIHFSKIEVGQYLPSWRTGRDYRRCYSASKKRGGGVALDLSHEIDYMRYFFGDPFSWKIVKAKISDLEIDSDDIFEGIYTYNHFICNVHMDYLQVNKKRFIRIEGSKGSLTCDLMAKKIMIETKGMKKTIVDKKLFDMDKTYVDEMLNFIKSIKINKDPFVTLDDGIKALELVGVDH